MLRFSHATGTCVFLLSVSFLLMSFRLTGAVQSLRGFLLYWVAPGQEAAAVSAAYAGSLASNLAGLVRAREENRVLKEKFQVFSALHARAEELDRENGRLKSMLEMRTVPPFDSVPCRVTARDPLNWNQAVWIDRGTRDGLKAEMPVISVPPGRLEGGAVGRIWESRPGSSKVLLLSDPLSSLAASLPRTGEQGLVRGQGSVVTVEYLDPLADVRPGDEVVTSGLGGVFPPGLPIGTLSKVMLSPSGFKRAELRPAVPPGSLREVLVLVRKKPGAAARE
ncbi:MAG: rod shape-determining protein MreC [Elusimicrobia bacterium RIFCSPLOWO2_01_FULL_64_13]|nr:MAG: rod shape-determining protein MreC [Elusimicrobia bacterium RIFCSPHIGHO2_01_FULL_64_10]OGR96546.1 MAG: rod shape-determining protein MreC [Elusimicrobia bacterium RIFCSPLOWO2_01_FULL_64_13]